MTIQAAPAASDVRERYSRMARALAGCSFMPGSCDKRFSRNMAALADHAPDMDFTERQRVHLIRLVHKYRRQLGASVTELAEAEAAAARRVDGGRDALADFTLDPARIVRQAERRLAREAKRRPEPTLPERLI